MPRGQAARRSSRSSASVHPVVAKLLLVLKRYLSSVNAQAVLRRAVSEAGGTLRDGDPAHLRRVNQSVQRALALFLAPREREAAAAEIAAICGVQPVDVEPQTLDVVCEADVARARAECRRVCEAMGANRYALQKVTTIVSELARNIVSYTPGGTIELRPRASSPMGMFVTARDTGAGITNLDEILAGHYVSRTGMGRGIRGCKRLADHFDLKTGPAGTCVKLEVRL